MRVLRLNGPEKQLSKLLKFKMEIQELEAENQLNKELWRDLGALVRHTSQKIGEKKRILFEMI